MTGLRSLLVGALVVLGATLGTDAGAQQSEPGEWAKPFLIVEGWFDWFDRDYTSDLYAFEMDGTLMRRLTSDLLPSSRLHGVAPVRGDPFFGAFYTLSLRGNMLTSIHAGNVLVAAVSPDGKTIAFVTEPDAQLGVDVPTPTRGRATPGSPLVLRVFPLVAGSLWRRAMLTLPAGGVPTEMTFTPDGEHVLITHWPEVDVARLLLVDLRTGAAQPVLDGGNVSYYEPVFAPDGRSLLAVREDLDAGAGWPAGAAASIDACLRGQAGFRAS